MKNLVYLSVVAMIAGLTACASDYDGHNYRYAEDDGCSDALIKPAPAPAPAPCAKPQPAPVVQDCGGCPAREFTVRTPVQVVYKNTTYRTVYEPRTFETSSYETRPYNRAEVCEGGNCYGSTVVTAQPVAQPAQPVAPAKPVYAAQPGSNQPTLLY